MLAAHCHVRASSNCVCHAGLVDGAIVQDDPTSIKQQHSQESGLRGWQMIVQEVKGHCNKTQSTVSATCPPSHLCHFRRRKTCLACTLKLSPRFAFS